MHKLLTGNSRFGRRDVGTTDRGAFPGQQIWTGMEPGGDGEEGSRWNRCRFRLPSPIPSPCTSGTAEPMLGSANRRGRWRNDACPHCRSGRRALAFPAAVRFADPASPSVCKRSIWLVAQDNTRYDIAVAVDWIGSQESHEKKSGPIIGSDRTGLDWTGLDVLGRSR